MLPEEHSILAGEMTVCLDKPNGMGFTHRISEK
jgi:hypothetical protein